MKRMKIMLSMRNIKRYFVFLLLFIKYYFYNILIGLDQFAGTLLGGSPDVTVCGRVWGWRLRGFTLPADILDKLFGSGHCEKAYEPDPADKSAAGKARKEYIRMYEKEQEKEKYINKDNGGIT